MSGPPATAPPPAGNSAHFGNSATWGAAKPEIAPHLRSGASQTQNRRARVQARKHQQDADANERRML